MRLDNGVVGDHIRKLHGSSVSHDTFCSLQVAAVDASVQHGIEQANRLLGTRLKDRKGVAQALVDDETLEQCDLVRTLGRRCHENGQHIFAAATKGRICDASPCRHIGQEVHAICAVVEAAQHNGVTAFDPLPCRCDIGTANQSTERRSGELHTALGSELLGPCQALGIIPLEVFKESTLQEGGREGLAVAELLEQGLERAFLC
mmetsp:Transcript_111204/g.248525  ORF Transcript_111204/g.248525 Transcript_111204/m.248525 type:complete len:204 (+) Transcript_111204:844-1455(+)